MAAYTGRTIGNYRIERLFGSGGMGTVFLAKHVKIGTPAIVKVLSPELARDESAKRRFENEARLASLIQHPHIVRIFDLGEMPSARPGAPPGETDLYMVMEFIEGEDCEAVLEREGRLDPLRVARILRQVASALDAAHTSPNGPIIHRDLKPGNIRLTRRGREEHAVVLDFGIAKAVEAPATERITVAGMIIGTPRYIAPEQAYGDSPVDGRTDIYSLGVVAYEMLAGKPPFQAPTAVQLFALHVFQPPPPLDPALGVPDELRAIVLRCLEKKPADRFQSAAELVEALDRFIASRSGGAGTKVAVAAGLAAVLAIGAATYFAATGRSGPAPVTLAALAADGRDVLGRESFFTRGDRVRLEGRLAGAAPEGGHRVEVDANGTRRRAELGADGAFAAEVAVAGRTLVEVHVAAHGGETLRVAALAVVQDRAPPRLAVRPPAGGDAFALDAAAGTVYLRAKEVFLPLDVADDAPAPELAVAGADGALAAEIDGAGVRLRATGAAEGDLGRIALAATDAAGNRAELALRAVLDATPPRLAWEEAPPASPGARVRLRLRAEDRLGVERVELSGTGPAGEIPPRAPDALEARDGAVLATFDLAVEEEGRYELRAAAVDRAGNRTEETVAFARAVAFEPAIALVDLAGEPRALEARGAAPLFARGAALRIEVRANKAIEIVKASLKVGDEAPRDAASGRATEGGAFACEVPLASGAHQTLGVYVKPAGAGEAVLRRFEVVHDDAPPAVRIAAPDPWPEVIGGARASDGAIAVEVAVEDANAGPALALVHRPAATEAEAADIEARLRAGGAAAAGAETLPLEGGRARARVPLADGTTLVLSVTAEDRAGNATTLVRRARVDLRPPAIVPALLPPFRVHDPYAIRFRAGEPCAAATIDGSSEGLRPDGPDGYVLEGVMLLDTPLERAIEVTDLAGNRARAVVRLERQAICGKTGEPIPPEHVKFALEKRAPRCPSCGDPMLAETTPR